jgi:hypothetical protein
MHRDRMRRLLSVPCRAAGLADPRMTRITLMDDRRRRRMPPAHGVSPSPQARELMNTFVSCLRRGTHNKVDAIVRGQELALVRDGQRHFLAISDAAAPKLDRIGGGVYRLQKTRSQLVVHVKCGANHYECLRIERHTESCRTPRAERQVRQIVCQRSISFVWGGAVGNISAVRSAANEQNLLKPREIIRGIRG